MPCNDEPTPDREFADRMRRAHDDHEALHSDGTDRSMAEGEYADLRADLRAELDRRLAEALTQRPDDHRSIHAVLHSSVPPVMTEHGPRWFWPGPVPDPDAPPPEPLGPEWREVGYTTDDGLTGGMVERRIHPDRWWTADSFVNLTPGSATIRDRVVALNEEVATDLKRKMDEAGIPPGAPITLAVDEPKPSTDGWDRNIVTIRAEVPMSAELLADYQRPRQPLTADELAAHERRQAEEARRQAEARAQADELVAAMRLEADPALAAMLEDHLPATAFQPEGDFRHSYSSWPKCHGCDQGCSCDSPEWPCTTVQAYAKARDLAVPRSAFDLDGWNPA